MNCDKCQNILLDYLYHELDDDLQEEFQNALPSCQKCAESLDDFKQVNLAYDKLIELNVPQKTHDDLIRASRLAIKEPKTLFSWNWGGLFAIAAILIVGFWTFNFFFKINTQTFDSQTMQAESTPSAAIMDQNQQAQTQERDLYLAQIQEPLEGGAEPVEPAEPELALSETELPALEEMEQNEEMEENETIVAQNFQTEQEEAHAPSRSSRSSRRENRSERERTTSRSQDNVRAMPSGAFERSDEELTPNQQQNHFEDAMNAYNENNYSQAIRLFRAHQQNAPNEHRPQTLFFLGSAYYRQENHQQARSILRQFVEQFPEHSYLEDAQTILNSLEQENEPMQRRRRRESAVPSNSEESFGQ